MKYNNEFILCAAVDYNGIIICGHRHKNCNETIEKMLNVSSDQTPDRSKQGFLTSQNRFVNRSEAFLIAKENNQIIHKMFDDDLTGILTSEDLY